MINKWWLAVICPVCSFFGFLAHALLSIAKKSDETAAHALKAKQEEDTER